MFVYRVIGKTASIDWASTSKDKELGLYQSVKAAQDKIEKMYEDKHWYMSWEGFTIEKVEVSG